MTTEGLMPDFNEPWENRRRSLSHDWFKDPRAILAKWLNVLAGQVIDPSFSSATVLEALKAWERSGKDGLTSLADAFPQDMSPRVLLHRAPLARAAADDRKWLGPLVHQLWMVREKSDLLVAELDQVIDAADAAYVALVTEVRVTNRLDEAAPDSGLRPRIAALQVAFAAVSSVLSSFPRKIHVV